MKTNLLSSDKDPMGTAIADYFHHNKADKLRVFSSQFEEDEIPVNQLFRPYDEMPELEQIALQIAEGNILDSGIAGLESVEEMMSAYESFSAKDIIWE